MADTSTRERAIRLCEDLEDACDIGGFDIAEDALTAERQAALTEACKRVRRVMEAGAARNQILAAIMGKESVE